MEACISGESVVGRIVTAKNTGQQRPGRRVKRPAECPTDIPSLRQRHWARHVACVLAGREADAYKHLEAIGRTYSAYSDNLTVGIAQVARYDAVVAAETARLNDLRVLGLGVDAPTHVDSTVIAATPPTATPVAATPLLTADELLDVSTPVSNCNGNISTPIAATPAAPALPEYTTAGGALPAATSDDGITPDGVVAQAHTTAAMPPVPPSPVAATPAGATPAPATWLASNGRSYPVHRRSYPVHRRKIAKVPPVTPQGARGETTTGVISGYTSGATHGGDGI
jgi:hypothetical protein